MFENKDKIKFLIIAPRRTVEKMYRETFKENQYYLEFIDDHADIFQILREYKPDIFISDYVLDTFFATGIFALLKFSSVFRNVKTVLITSNDPDDIAGKEYCDHILNKNTNFYESVKELSDKLFNE